MYTLECSTDNRVSWNVLASGMSETTYDYVIPSVQSVCFRVKAVDSQENASEYTVGDVVRVEHIFTNRIVGKAIGPDTPFDTLGLVAITPTYIIGRSIGEKTLMIPAKNTLENTSWADIDRVSKLGMCPEYWNIGDTKSVLIDGMTYYAEIIGFSHDDLADGSGKAGITFGLKDCLNSLYTMNSTATNEGGWGGCELRTTLQSTIFNQLESELTTVIKPVTKKASAGNQSTAINSYTDTLFLFAEKEVFGSIQYSADGEGDQYSRFQTASTRIKNSNGSASYWWLRSPFRNNTTYFCYVTRSGLSNDFGTANRTYGVSFGFCV